MKTYSARWNDNIFWWLLMVNLLKNSLEFNNKASPRSKQTKKKNNF